MLNKDDTITEIVVFSDGCQMDIKLCSTEDELAWTEAVLFNKDGYELCCTEPADEFIGEWNLTYDDNSYTVIVSIESIEVPTETSSISYVALISGEYIRNAEIFGSTYDEENMDDYIYDDSHWQEASNAEIFIGIFTCSKNMDEEALLELKKEAAATAVVKGLCNRLPIDAVKLIEV